MIATKVHYMTDIIWVFWLTVYKMQAHSNIHFYCFKHKHNIQDVYS